MFSNNQGVFLVSPPALQLSTKPLGDSAQQHMKQLQAQKVPISLGAKVGT